MSPRGGKRKGAGRPEMEESEKLTETLGYVRVSPMELANYRDAAKRSGLNLTDWVKWWLDQGLDEVVNSMIGTPEQRKGVLDELAAEGVIGKPKKRKGKKA